MSDKCNEEGFIAQYHLPQITNANIFPFQTEISGTVSSGSSWKQKAKKPFIAPEI